MNAATAIVVDDEKRAKQRMVALRRANRTRSQRSDLKAGVKAGRVKASRIVLDPPAYALSMDVLALMKATPKMGRVKANAILRRCRISPTKKIGELSERQRSELVPAIRKAER